jgi:hypothetical protein
LIYVCYCCDFSPPNNSVIKQQQTPPRALSQKQQATLALES